MSSISANDFKTIITDPDGTQTLVKTADAVGLELKNMGLTTSQIRALFGEVRKIQAQWMDNTEVENQTNRKKALHRLILLKPKMAYRSRKERGSAVKELVDVLNPALDLVINEKDPTKQNENFQRFVEFFEAILAYHKSYGGN